MKKFLILLAVVFFSLSNVGFAVGLNEPLSGNVLMNGEFLDDNILKISVSVNDLSAPVLGIAFHLIYDKVALHFLKYESGEFLERGGKPFYLVSDGKTGIVFGQTLRKNDNFPLGSGEIATFYFEIVDGNEFNFAFDRGAISTLDIVMQDLSNIEWQNYSIKKPLNKYFGASVINSGNLFGGSVREIFTMVGISFFSLLFAVLVIRKYGNKRHNSYVNFK